MMKESPFSIKQQLLVQNTHLVLSTSKFNPWRYQAYDSSIPSQKGTTNQWWIYWHSIEQDFGVACLVGISFDWVKERRRVSHTTNIVLPTTVTLISMTFSDGWPFSSKAVTPTWSSSTFKSLMHSFIYPLTEWRSGIRFMQWIRRLKRGAMFKKRLFHIECSLVNILKKGSSNPQVTYEIVFAIWLLTFDRDIAANLNKKYDVIPTLIEVAKHAVKEKIIRVVVATFKVGWFASLHCFLSTYDMFCLEFDWQGTPSQSFGHVGCQVVAICWTSKHTQVVWSRGGGWHWIRSRTFAGQLSKFDVSYSFGGGRDCGLDTQWV